MPFVHAKGTAVLLDERELSGFFNATDLSGDGEIAETTTYGAAGDAKTFIRGLNSGTVTLGGFYDSAAAADGELSTNRTSELSQLVTIGPEGLAIGKVVRLLASRETSYVVSSPVTDVVAISVDLTVDGILDRGVSLHDLVAEEATANFASVDNGASTAAGGLGQLHVTGFSGFTNVIVRVQHSVDNVVFTDLITFATVTGAISERVTLAGTINRFLRATLTVIGVGSVIFQISFGRQ